MLCQQCKQRDATIHMTQVVNHVKEEYHLCRACASALQGGGMGSKSPWGDLFEPVLPGPSLFGYPLSRPDRRAAPKRVVCPQCGESERELRDTGLLGCSQCYETFFDLLIPVFRRAQGHTQHIQVPDDSAPWIAITESASKEEENEPTSKIEQLRSELRTAVEREDYKEAARLRDAIHELEKETST